MSPRRIPTGYKMPSRQAGYLMPLAIFIVVIMGFFVATLSRTTTQASLSATQEGVTLQAFYAAESGAQLGMNSLFYNTASALDRVTLNGLCTGMNLTPSFTATGLSNCSATVDCTADTSVAGTSFYTVTSIGQCGAGTISSTRTIQVSARME